MEMRSESESNLSVLTRGSPKLGGRAMSIDRVTVALAFVAMSDGRTEGLVAMSKGSYRNAGATWIKEGSRYSLVERSTSLAQALNTVMGN